MISIAILGYGTVGSGILEVMTRNSSIIDNKSGQEVKVKSVLDLRDFPGDPVEDILVHDVNTIMKDDEIKIICETMGGLEPAFTFTKRALELGKSVCTSNKELVAAHGPELIALAKANKCNYLFEASVGGGIPIIRPLNSCLPQERIEGITGILNGTTNYILSKMAREGADFQDVLLKAQEKGYAEKNPEADVEGYDACRKIAILTSLMTGKTVDYKEIYTEGITKISATDFLYAKKMGKAIKLFALSRETQEGYYAMVAPFMIGDEHPLFSVSGVYNGVLVHGNMVDDTMYYGRGAGKLPTASAVVSDVIDCARHQGKTVTCLWDMERLELISKDNAKRRFFVRLKGEAEERLEEIHRILGHTEVILVEGIQNEFGIITSAMSEKEFEEKLKLIEGIRTRIRLEEYAG